GVTLMELVLPVLVNTARRKVNIAEGASSTNDINIVNPEVSTATTKVKTASTEISTATFSDATVYAFLSTQPQGSQLNVSTAIKWDILPENAEPHPRRIKTTEKLGNQALKKQYDDLLVKLDDTGFKAATYKRGLKEFKQPEVNEYGPRDSSLKPTIGCDKESNNSKENIDDSLEQHQKTDTETSSVKEVELKKVRENNDAPIIEDWVSDDEDDDEPNPKVEKKTVIPTATKKELYMS
ncbi:hypothetical protein Tco_0230809, partial [Tanacetum coccineum]